MGSQGCRRTRKLCRAQQISITRSRTPSFHRRIRSFTMRHRLTLLLTCSIRSRRWCRAWCARTALDALKESGDLEDAADVVLFLTEAQERCATPPARAVELTVAKNRHGDTGKVGLIFRPDLGTIREEARS